MKHALSLSLLLIFGVVGCQQNASVPLFQAVNSDKAAVLAATTLYGDGKVSKADAQSIYLGAAAAESAMRIWQVAIAGNDPAAITAAKQAVSDDLANLLKQLQAVQNKSAALRMQASASRFKATGKAAQLAPTDIITIVELAVQLAPVIEQWAATIFDQNPVTAAQVNQAFSELDSALTALATALHPPTTQP